MAQSSPGPEPPPSNSRRTHRHGGAQKHQHDVIELTQEEKAVLIECRRKSLFRGVPAAFGSMLVLRWFVQQGRTPLHVQRWSGAYYSLTFMAGFFFGVSSYKKTCFDKIMALENSKLADQLRARRGMGMCDQENLGQQEPRAAGQYRRRSTKPLRTPSSVKLPAKESRGSSYSESGTVSSSEVYTGGPIEALEDQPSAFGRSPLLPSSPDQESKPEDRGSSPQSRGRTFDEIREESRQRQLQQNFPRSSAKGEGGGRGRESTSHAERDWRQQGATGRGGAGDKPVRRNKYGDVIGDENN